MTIAEIPQNLLPANQAVTALVARDAPPAINQLMQHAQAMQVAYDLAKAMCASELVPAIYRGKPENGAAAILYGMELGLNPIQSLQQIFVVHGAPAIYARTMVALVKSHGHEIWTESSSDTEVTVCGRRRGETHVEPSTWSIERAKMAGYTTNKKYLSDPQAMLYAKAAAEVCRKMAPDILLGIAYTREELELAQPSPVSPNRPVRGVAGLRSKLGIEAPASAPAAAPAPAPVSQDEPAAPTVAMASKIQLDELAALLDKEGITSKADKLEWLNGQPFGRVLKNAGELTETEAGELIGFLAEAQAADTTADGAGA